MTPWTDYPITFFDTETSGLGPDAFVVTACIGDLGADPAEDAVPLQFLLAPPDGREIPDEAAAIHGVSTEHAATFGTPYAEGMAQIAAALTRAAMNRRALVAFNVQFDWSLMTREAHRLGLHLAEPPLFIDPLVIDRGVAPNLRETATDPETGRTFQRRVSRKLVNVAARFGVSLPEDAAHDALADAVAAGQLARVMQQRIATAPATAAPAIRQLQSMDAEQMMRWQAGAHRGHQEEFGAYLRSVGRADDTDGGFPVSDAVSGLIRASAGLAPA